MTQQETFTLKQLQELMCLLNAISIPDYQPHAYLRQKLERMIREFPAKEETMINGIPVTRESGQ